MWSSMVMILLSNSTRRSRRDSRGFYKHCLIFARSYWSPDATASRSQIAIGRETCLRQATCLVRGWNLLLTLKWCLGANQPTEGGWQDLWVVMFLWLKIKAVLLKWNAPCNLKVVQLVTCQFRSVSFQNAQSSVTSDEHQKTHSLLIWWIPIITSLVCKQHYVLLTYQFDKKTFRIKKMAHKAQNSIFSFYYDYLFYIQYKTSQKHMYKPSRISLDSNKRPSY